MKNRSFPHNAVFIFSLLLVCWSVYSFFSWQIQPMPEKMPEAVAEKIKSDGLPGEPVFLSSQLMDSFVLNHPDINIFPAGGEVLKNAKDIQTFYIIEAYKGLGCSDVSPKLIEKNVMRDGEYTLKECYMSDRQDRSFNASSFIEKFTVTVPLSEKPVEFKRGHFKTGHNGWQKIETGLAEFSGKSVLAVSAHPLPEGHEIKVEIPPVDRKVSRIYAGFGIADSGKMKGSKPVDIKISQAGREVEFHSVDGKWLEQELKSFSPHEPLSIVISTENSGKRHFYFDIRYVLGERK